MTENTTHRAAAIFFAEPGYRFTIRTVEGRELRKMIPAARFLAVRKQYRDTPVRVDVTHLDNDDVQTWNLGITRWLGSN